jgi:hypothetical protein
MATAAVAHGAPRTGNPARDAVGNRKQHRMRITVVASRVETSQKSYQKLS